VFSLSSSRGHSHRTYRKNIFENLPDRADQTLEGRHPLIPPERTLHAFRHTFAVHYLRKGGSVFHLQKVLGHSTLEMTRRYANLLTEDLQAVHQKISLLAA
jgi:site-specific recombinase XerD